MSKAKKAVLLLLLLAVLLCVLACWDLYDTAVADLISGVTQNFTYGPLEQDGPLSYACRNFPRDAFVGSYTYTEYADTQIVIPDRYGKYKVTAIGNWGPEMFRFQLPPLGEETHSFTSYSTRHTYLPEDPQVLYYDFQLTIGKNINSISTSPLIVIYWPEGSNAGTPIVQIPRVYATCSEENRHFYSQDGRLYYKDGTLVDVFIYHDQEF